ncbi:MAG: hypothetical protein ACM36B_02500 [Bacteroidota bacterium]
MRTVNPTANDLSMEVRRRANQAIGPWKLSADDAQWAQAGKWSHAVAIGILGAWFIAVSALTGGPVNAATPERAATSESTVYVPEPIAQTRTEITPAF